MKIIGQNLSNQLEIILHYFSGYILDFEKALQLNESNQNRQPMKYVITSQLID